MSSPQRQDSRPETRRRSYWLPPHGTGNGLTASAWAPIADLSSSDASAMLSTCALAGIAAFASPRDGGRPHRSPSVQRVWVASRRFGAAEDALRHVVTHHPAHTVARHGDHSRDPVDLSSDAGTT